MIYGKWISFDLWRHKYHHERPHEALGGKTPSDKYCVRSKRFSEKPLPFEYQDGFVKKAHKNNGTISFKGIRFIVGKGFNGEIHSC